MEKEKNQKRSGRRLKLLVNRKSLDKGEDLLDCIAGNNILPPEYILLSSIPGKRNHYILLEASFSPNELSIAFDLGLVKRTKASRCSQPVIIGTSLVRWAEFEDGTVIDFEEGVLVGHLKNIQKVLNEVFLAVVTDED